MEDRMPRIMKSDRCFASGRDGEPPIPRIDIREIEREDESPGRGMFAACHKATPPGHPHYRRRDIAR